MMHGPQQGLFDLSFAVPSVCADRLEREEADIGIVPVIEMHRQGLQMIPGAGIACRGPVRSILLVSKTPFSQIRTLAADSSSRTSVMLARILLAEKFAVEPTFVSAEPDIEAMLNGADAALVIGDTALRLDPLELPYFSVDLGEQWVRFTGKPMVFAVWAGRKPLPDGDLAGVFQGSCRYGLEHLDTIIGEESAKRGIPEVLSRWYLSNHIRFEIGAEEIEGMELFLEHAARTVAV